MKPKQEQPENTDYDGQRSALAFFAAFRPGVAT